MNPTRVTRLPHTPTLFLLLILAAGCASPQMKGTPFYSGEYSVRQGPVEDRVNLWPLLYYRAPALSVLWPIGELTDDHLAVRPLFSVYGLDREKREYNVLWPLAQFDTSRNEHRIFPVYWGKDHAAVFPLYWHYGTPDDTRLTDGLLPAWWYHRNPRGFTFHALPPVFNVKKGTRENGWRIWPLAGDYTDRDDRYSFALWPLGHRWSEDGGNTGGSTILPLYWCSRTPDRRLLLSPLYSAGSDNGGLREWSLAMPIYYESKDRDAHTFATLLGGYTENPAGKRWTIYPLLSTAKFAENSGDVWIVAPVFRGKWGPDGRQSHLFPIYYWNEKSNILLSPLLSRWGKADDRTTLIPPLVSWLSTDRHRSDLWALGPVSHFSWGERPGPTHVLPLFYTDPRTDTFLSPLAGWSRSRTGGFLYPLTPLAGIRTGDTSGGWLFPLFSRACEDDTGRIRGTFLWGAYSRSQDYGSCSLFPLFGYKRRDAVATDDRKAGDVRLYSKDFWCVPGCWYRRELDLDPDLAARRRGETNATVRVHTKQHGVFPLWSYSKRQIDDQVRRETDARLLLVLADYRRRVERKTADIPRHDYVRRRILWRLLHYERLDDEVSIDVFPAITYDRKKTDDFRSFSFLWRFFRYEREADKRTLDLLFVPLMRPRSSEPAP